MKKEMKINILLSYLSFIGVFWPFDFECIMVIQHNLCPLFLFDATSNAFGKFNNVRVNFLARNNLILM